MPVTVNEFKKTKKEKKPWTGPPSPSRAAALPPPDPVDPPPDGPRAPPEDRIEGAAPPEGRIEGTAPLEEVAPHATGPPAPELTGSCCYGGGSCTGLVVRKRNTHRIRALGGRGCPPPWWRGGGARAGSSFSGRVTEGRVGGGSTLPARPPTVATSPTLTGSYYCSLCHRKGGGSRDPPDLGGRESCPCTTVDGEEGSHAS
jgi:hypothetical protein